MAARCYHSQAAARIGAAWQARRVNPAAGCSAGPRVLYLHCAPQIRSWSADHWRIQGGGIRGKCPPRIGTGQIARISFCKTKCNQPSQKKVNLKLLRNALGSENRDSFLQILCNFFGCMPPAVSKINFLGPSVHAETHNGRPKDKPKMS